MWVAGFLGEDVSLHLVLSVDGSHSDCHALLIVAQFTSHGNFYKEIV